MELLDIYDGARKKTGRRIPRSMRGDISKGEHFLVVHTCVFNAGGEMLIQRRSESKQAYPGRWDLSSGGFARSGEDAPEAALRELGEELGLSLSRRELRFAFTAELEMVFDDFFCVARELEPASLRLQEEELTAVRWAGMEEILAMIASGEFIDYEPGLIRDAFRFASTLK